MKTIWIDMEEFAGGGGATTGHRIATGRGVHVAVNHSRTAVAMHTMNFPETLHFCQNVWQIDPLELLDLIAKMFGAGEAVRIAIASGWFSPDCKHFSKAKGGALVDKRIRGLAYIMLKWCGRGRRQMPAPSTGSGSTGTRRAHALRGPACPLVLRMENVEEFMTWGPLVAKRDKATGRVVKADETVAARGEVVKYADQWLVPDPKRAGLYFKRFVAQLRAFGGEVEWRVIKACDLGAPTIRKRFYLESCFDGAPCAWPEMSHAEPVAAAVQAGLLKAHRTTAECLELGLPCPSVLMTRRQARAYYEKTGTRIQRPIKRSTNKRLAKGVLRHVMEAGDPFIVCLTHEGNDGVESIHEPAKTVTGANRGERALVAPLLAGFGGPAYQGKPRAVNKPFHTMTTENHTGCVQASLAAVSVTHTAHGERDKNGKKRGKGSRSVRLPAPGLTASNDLAVTRASLAAPFDKPFRRAQGELRTCGVPFVSAAQHGGSTRGAAVPCHTLTASEKDQNQVVVAHIVKLRGDNVGHAAGEPAHTLSAGGNHLGVAATFLAQHNGGETGHQHYGHPVTVPASTLTGRGTQQQVVACALSTYYGNDGNPKLTDPAPTMTTHDRVALTHAAIEIPPLTPEKAKRARQVANWLRRHGVKVEGEFAKIKGTELVIWDIGMRMLIPREQFRIQGFPESYIISHGVFEENGVSVIKPLTKTQQTELCGNSVCPDVAAAIIAARPPRIPREGLEVAA